MKGLSKEVREIMKEYIGDNSVAGVTVLAVQDGKEICDCQEGCIPRTKNLAQRQMRSAFARRTGDAGCRSFTDDVGADLWRYDDGAGADV